MRIEIRPASAADVAAVLALWERAAEPTTTDTADAVAALLTRVPGALLVAEESGEIVGTVIAAWDGWRGSVYRLAVAPGQRRRGLGRRLLAAAEARLHGLGAHRMHAIVIGDDHRAVGFWQASDWEHQDGQLRFVRS
ncbi:MAG TPA: GNAT family N-acetyltransferase [Acidimicrobiales bacterium]|nr:GNAT family N-acetyltransferase [Acidimicrobiales bacterium]